MQRAVWLAVFVVLLPWATYAQTAPKSAAASSDSDQTQRDILKEIRLLRAQLLRSSVNANRSQMLLARARAEQEQVIRINRELNQIHDSLDEIRAQLQKKTAELTEVVPMVELQARPERDATAIKTEMEFLRNREQSLLERQEKLNGDLDAAQQMLATLDARLDDIDREMANTAEGATTGRTQ